MPTQRMYDDLDKETIEEILDEPEPTLDREATTIIYLDQNIWGRLHDGRHNPDSDYRDAYETVQHSVDDGTTIYPYSLTRFFETDAHPDITFKRQLYTLMVDLSNNFCFHNYFDATSVEITAFLFNNTDYLPTIDHADQIFGWGLIEPMGRPTITVDGDPMEATAILTQVHRSETFTRRVLQTDHFFEEAPDDHRTARDEYVDTLESIRQDAQSLADTDADRWLILLARSFVNDILPRLATTAHKLDIDIEEIFTDELYTARFDPRTPYQLAADTTDLPIGFILFDNLVAQFPTYYTHLNLTLGRDFHWDREIEANDLEDVMSLAVAIPYADIVVSEEFFGGVAHKHGLPDQYDTTILTNLEALEDYLTAMD